MIVKHKKAFSLITSIFLIVLLSTLAIFVFSLSGKIGSSTTAQFQKEQSALLAKSYTEHAIMTVMSNNRSGECVENIDGHIGALNAYKNGQGYSVETRISFIGSAAEIVKCSGTRQWGNTSNEELNIVVDVYVKYKDITHPLLGNAVGSTPWITYHKRTLQKI